MNSTNSSPVMELQNRNLSTHPVSTDVISSGNTILDEENREIEERAIPPLDRGLAAWRLVAVAFVFEALLWGFPLSFGVFQNYYAHLPQFANNPYIPIVGTVASGISYLGAPLVTQFIKRYPQYQKHMIWIGWPLCILGLIAGSFATTLETLILTQGIMYGLGFLLFYYPILSFIDSFFISKRGTVYGILCASSGVSGIVMPFAIQALLDAYGYQITLRVIAVGLAVITGPLIPFLKGRLPAAVEDGRAEMSGCWVCLRHPLFWVYFISNVVQGLGYFFPSLYLPSYASAIGLSSREGAMLLAFLSIAQVLGQFCFGYLSDRKLKLDVLIFLSTVISAVACMAGWGLAKSLPGLLVFSIVFGFFGAGYTAMWARMGSAVTQEPNAALTTFSLFCFGKGVGNVVAGPVSSALLSRTVSVGSYGISSYRAVILFAGSCMLGSAVCVCSWYANPKRLYLGRT